MARPAYFLRVGQTIHVRERNNACKMRLRHIRRSRGWDVRQRKVGTEIAITRHA